MDWSIRPHRWQSRLDLIGCPSLHLWLSLDVPDTDLEAYLYEIQPDGTNIRLWTNTCRLRYRESLRAAKLVKPGEIVACDLAPGLFVARSLNERKPSPPRHLLSKHDLGGEKLQFRRSGGGGNGEKCARGARPNLSRRRASERAPNVADFAAQIMRTFSLDRLLRQCSEARNYEPQLLPILFPCAALLAVVSITGHILHRLKSCEDTHDTS